MKALLLALVLLFPAVVEAKPRKPDVEILSQSGSHNVRRLKLRVNVRRTVEVYLDCGEEFYSVTPIKIVGPRKLVVVELTSTQSIPECVIGVVK